MSETILKRVFLKTVHSTSPTSHIVYGNKLDSSQIAELRIVQLDSDILLYYCDKEGNELTDTWHENEESAMQQAEYEFGVKCDEWQS